MKSSATEVASLPNPTRWNRKKESSEPTVPWMIMSASFKFTEGAPCASAIRLNSKIQPLKAGSGGALLALVQLFEDVERYGDSPPLRSINSSSFGETTEPPVGAIAKLPEFSANIGTSNRFTAVAISRFEPSPKDLSQFLDDFCELFLNVGHRIIKYFFTYTMSVDANNAI
jgi:hypothetical protein